MLLKTFLFFLFFSNLSLRAQPEVLKDSSKKFRIVIDPGHGGEDLGAVRDSFIEADIVHVVASKLQSRLNQNSNFSSWLTRSSTETLPLKTRVKIAHDYNADLFVSLHANTSNALSASGMEFYFNSEKPMALRTSNLASASIIHNSDSVLQKIQSDFALYEKTKLSFLMSELVQNSSENQKEKSVVKRASFFVLDNTKMPSVLIELGFLSNRRDAKKLTTQNYQDKIVQIIYDAILAYKEKSDKTTSVIEK